MADDKDLDLDVTEEEKPKSKLVLIVIVLVVVLAGGGAAAFFLMSGGGGDDEDFEEGEVAEVKKVAIYVPMKPAFVINFMVGGRTRYAQIDVTLMTRDGYVVDAFVSKYALSLYIRNIEHDPFLDQVNI
ncbi:MAG: hypothetical protein JKY24_09795 [Pseudomonadales bacterium]|nr:hypothetical protein [Pseudomonadales bacterium]